MSNFGLGDMESSYTRRYYMWKKTLEIDESTPVDYSLVSKIVDKRCRFTKLEDKVCLGVIKAFACQNKSLTGLEIDAMMLNFRRDYNFQPPKGSPAFSQTSNAIRL